MADETATTVTEAAADAAQAVTEAAAVERAEAAADISAVVADAAEAIDAANERAEAIAEAAMNTEIGRRLADLDRRFEEWRGAHEQLHSTLQMELTQTAARLTEVETRLATLAGMEIQEALTQAPPTPSTPPLLEQTEQLTEAVIPEAQEVIAQSENTLVENPPRRKRLFR